MLRRRCCLLGAKVFTDGYPVSHLAGADFPGRILRMLAGEKVTDSFIDYQAGVTTMKRLEVIAGPSGRA